MEVFFILPFFEFLTLNVDKKIKKNPIYQLV